MAGKLKPRLLAITHDYSLCGAPVVLYKGLCGLAERYQLEVAGPKDGPLRERYAAAGVRAVVAPGLLEDPGVAARLLAGRDLLLANTIVSFLPVRAAAELGKPSLWYLHEGQFGLEFMTAFPGIEPTLPLAGCIAYPAAFCRAIYEEWRAGRWTEVLPFGVEERVAAPASGGEGLRVLQLGSIEPRKGQDVALAALRLLKDRPVRLEVAGRTLVPQFERRLLDEFADVQAVRYLGEVGLDAAAELLRACDVLVVPSRDEVAPMVVVEAMALGKAVVAARVGAVPEMVVDGKSGLLFDAGDAPQLAAALERLRADPALRAKLGAAGQARQRRLWSLAQFHARLGALVERLLG